MIILFYLVENTKLIDLLFYWFNIKQIEVVLSETVH